MPRKEQTEWHRILSEGRHLLPNDWDFDHTEQYAFCGMKKAFLQPSTGISDLTRTLTFGTVNIDKLWPHYALDDLYLLIPSDRSEKDESEMADYEYTPISPDLGESDEGENGGFAPVPSTEEHAEGDKSDHSEDDRASLDTEYGRSRRKVVLLARRGTERNPGRPRRLLETRWCPTVHKALIQFVDEVARRTLRLMDDADSENDDHDNGYNSGRRRGGRRDQRVDSPKRKRSEDHDSNDGGDDDDNSAHTRKRENRAAVSRNGRTAKHAVVNEKGQRTQEAHGQAQEAPVMKRDEESPRQPSIHGNVMTATQRW
ncbi:hypothetical protein NA57DRAFT_51620 [Rhizodiscina lignyota]|uniref:Uncharacterized protein n=1 Tax=Rhizodiscina lignyota TaxID=1504668 RepID=A0A9P4ISZ6_9PEZI|nr:hypothetical protein NA57DRAFT_51620 [Rhizodiscina lignyota]